MPQRECACFVLSFLFYTPYRFTVVKRKTRWHSYTGTALATLMWLWVFYRAQEDGAVVLGLVDPWDAHGHHDDDDGHKFEKDGMGEVPTAVPEEEH